MKKLFLLTFVCFTFQGNTGQAILPPLWQNVAELKAILKDEQLGQFLQSGESITHIKKTNNGWVIITNKHELPIRVSYKKANQPGPAHFDLFFEPITLTNSKPLISP